MSVHKKNSKLIHHFDFQHSNHKHKNILPSILASSGVALLAFMSAAPNAEAVPSFARQTGAACTACHVGGFGPQLTPFGRRFKMLAYAQGSSPKWKLPISGMVVASFDSTKTGVPGGTAPPHFGENNNFAFDEASVFLAGKLAPNLGVFSQLTYSGVDRAVALDNTDIRYARETDIGGKDLIVGVSVNNNPTIQDPWNSTPGWGFPFAGSELAPAPGAGTMINGGLETQVIGTTVYGFYNNMLYVEAGQYTTIAQNTLGTLGIGADAGRMSGLAPYWRIALNKDSDSQSFSVGSFGMVTKLFPNRVRGLKNKFSDVGFDATYQYFKGNNTVSVNSRYVHERQTLNADFAAGDAANIRNTLNSFNMNAAYYYQNKYGLSAGYFSTSGSRDVGIYAPAEIEGSRLGKPNSSGLVFQADLTPFGKDDSWGKPLANMRVGLQYTAYNKFNGGKQNYDGLGRNASDNNTLFLFSWLAF
jgi:hypothetical protein